MCEGMNSQKKCWRKDKGTKIYIEYPYYTSMPPRRDNNNKQRKYKQNKKKTKTRRNNRRLSYHFVITPHGVKDQGQNDAQLTSAT